MHPAGALHTPRVQQQDKGERDGTNDGCAYVLDTSIRI